MLVVKQLKKTFGSQTVLNGIHLVIHPGETVGILGASGSGKSTLLRCMNHLEMPTAGMVSIQGVGHGTQGYLGALRSQVGMVFQGFNLFSNMTVLENLIYAPVTLKKMTRGDAIEKAVHLLSRVSLESKAQAFPHTLSGGEKQRVAISRTLMMDPKVILFDEPTSSLDPKMVKEMIQLMKDLAASGMTLVIVSHEMGFVQQVADRVVYLEKGKITQDMPTRDFFKQEHAFVSGLLT